MNDKTLVGKLDKLTNTQQSIQALSLWVIYHVKKAGEIVSIWAREVKKAAPNRKLCYYYLANDVIQNSRKKTNAFVEQFQAVLPGSLRDNISLMTEKDRKSLQRIFNILEERKIFTLDFSSECKRVIDGSLGGGSGGGGSSSSAATSTRNGGGGGSSDNPLKRERPAATSGSSGGSAHSSGSGSGSGGSSHLDALTQMANNVAFVKSLLQFYEIVQANRSDQKNVTADNDKLVQECKQRVLDRNELREDQLAQSTPFTLKQLQGDVEGVLTKCSDYKFALANENNKRKEYILALKEEMNEQLNLFEQCDDLIKEWNDNYLVELQKISTSLEIHLNNKQFNGGGNDIDDVLTGNQDDGEIVETTYADDFFKVDEDEVSEPSNKKLKTEPTYDEDDEELFTETKPISSTNTLNLVNSILSALGNKNTNPQAPSLGEYEPNEFPPFD